jgi:HAD superfamily hydrolase (TIGR01509 family)
VPPELVIFDCDGVLVDSERIAVKVDRAILASVGIEMTEGEIVDRFVGRSAAVIYAAMEEALGRQVSASERAHFDRLYRDAFAAELTPVDGVRTALDAISLPVCVASSSDPDNLRQKLALTGLSSYFDGHVFSAAQVTRGKPAPDLFLFAAARMGTPPERCVVIEDSQYGVQAGLAAGMRVLAYAGGLTPTGGLARDGVVVFEDMRTLPELVLADR